MPNLLLFGATGYVGGSLLASLRSAYPDAHITALVRSESNFEAVRAAGVNSILHATHSDAEKIRKAASEADVVLNLADSDSLPLIQAIIAGMRDYFQQNKKRPILIHTSGTGVIMDRAHGNYVAETAEKAWDDTDEESIKGIPPTAFHRNVDNEVFKADEEGFIDGYIVAPPTIYGIGSGPVNRISIQIPILIKLDIKVGKGVYLGEGTSIWNNLHIDDLVDFYLLLLKHALAADTRATQTSPYSKFYFVIGGTHVWGEVARDVAKILHKHGALPSPDAESMSVTDASKFEPFAIAVATNSNGSAVRAKSLGWAPKRKPFHDCLEAEVVEYLNKSGNK